MNQPRFIRDLETDNLSGASDLFQKALNGLVEWSKSQSDAFSRAQIKKVLAGIVAAQPTMAAFVNLERILIRNLGEADSISPRNFQDTLQHFRDFLKADKEKLVQNGVDYILDNETYLTFSNSSSVADIFLEARKKRTNFKVICPESRPMREGVRMAERLHESGIEVELIVDAAIFSQIKECQAVFVGADAVTDEWWANKIGTSFLCLAAREYGIPVWCCCEATKLIEARDFHFNAVDRPADEVNPGRLPVRNIYYEQMRLNWLAGLITSVGVLASPLELTVMRTLNSPQLRTRPE